MLKNIEKHAPHYILGFPNPSSLRQPKLLIEAWQRKKEALYEEAYTVLGFSDLDRENR
jgi:hypothetical protein